MKILLTAINAKFVHLSLAIRSLKKYAEKFNQDYSNNIFLNEFTINQDINFILNEIYKEKPDVLGFSCYIWNINIILELVKNIKKLLPKVVIILGGPEVSYESKNFILENDFIDIIIKGEGEATFYEISKYYIDNIGNIEDIDGIVYKKNNQIIETPKREEIFLDDIPFVYDDINDFENKIIYYETQRGCPYKCQYCLSSIERGIRFLSEKRVKSDLKFFIDNNVKQVKFIDRTFNSNKKHSKMIWKYIIDNDNGKTNFHMEVIADTIDDDMFNILKQARKGLFQFEIGIQSTNSETIKAIKRNTNFEKISENVKKIYSFGNIHQHLDLIVGLPFEDYNSFKNSFNDVFELKPQQLQLGFLKLLRGSGLRYNADIYGIVYRDKANYEVLFTNYINYDEIQKLKLVEEMVEIYYNSGKAINTINYIIRLYISPFDFFQDLGIYWESMNYHSIKHNKIELYKILYDFSSTNRFLKNNKNIIKELLRFDVFCNDNIKTFPIELLEDFYILNDLERIKNRKNNIMKFYKNIDNIKKYAYKIKDFSYQQISRMCHIEFFQYDVIGISSNSLDKIEEIETVVLFNYYDRDEISNKPLYYRIFLD